MSGLDVGVFKVGFHQHLHPNFHGVSEDDSTLTSSGSSGLGLYMPMDEIVTFFEC